MKGYYFITDAHLSRAGIYKDTQKALDAGVKVIQYRNKQASSAQMYKEAGALRCLCKKRIFLVNDRLDIALAVGADGVHLGADDLPYEVARKILGKDKLIGMTVHTLKQARDAQKKGCDYVGVGPVFRTRTKKDCLAPTGIRLIREVKKYLRIPVVAIGGINLSNAPGVVSAGADMLCAISAVVSAQDVARQIRAFQQLYFSSLTWR